MSLSFARYSPSGRVKIERLDQEVQDTARAKFPDGVPCGTIFDDEGRVMGEPMSKEGGLIIIDRAVAKGRMSQDSAEHVRAQLAACTELPDTLCEFTMVDMPTDEEGYRYATVSPILAITVMSRADARDVVRKNFAKGGVHASYLDRHLECIERLDIPETLLGVQPDGENVYVMIDRAGNKCFRFDSLEFGRMQLAVGLKNGDITEEEHALISSEMERLCEARAIRSTCITIDIRENAQGKPQGTLHFSGPDPKAFRYFSINALRCVIRHLHKEWDLTLARAGELLAALPEPSGLPTSVAHIYRCTCEESGAGTPHVHIVDEFGDAFETPVYSCFQLGIWLRTMIRQCRLEREAYDTLMGLGRGMGMPQSHEFDEMMAIAGDLVRAAENLPGHPDIALHVAVK